MTTEQDGTMLGPEHQPAPFNSPKSRSKTPSPSNSGSGRPVQETGMNDSGYHEDALVVSGSISVSSSKMTTVPTDPAAGGVQEIIPISEGMAEGKEVRDSDETPNSKKEDFVYHLPELRMTLSRHHRKKCKRNIKNPKLKALRTETEVLTDFSGVNLDLHLISPQSDYHFSVQVEAIFHDCKARSDLGTTDLETEFDALTNKAECKIVLTDSEVLKQHDRRDLEIIVRATVRGK